MQERRQDALDEIVVMVAGELMLHVDEVAIHRVEPTRDEFAHVQAHAR
jgi:hypothetical protein